MGIVGEDVVHDALHVPRVRTTGHVPVTRSKSIHGWNRVPLYTDSQTNEEGQTDHHTCSVGSKEEARLRGLMLSEVGPTAVAFMVPYGIDSNTEEEGDGKPNQGTPRSVKILVVPNSCFKPSSHLVERPHRTNEHGTSVPSLRHHTGDDKGNNTGQESAPIAGIAVVSVLRSDAELVDHIDAVEVPK